MIYVSWGSAIVAGLAAIFWLASARVSLPKLSTVLSDIDKLGPFHSAMKKVGRLNAIAAGCAFLSAFLQTLAHAASSARALTPGSKRIFTLSR